MGDHTLITEQTSETKIGKLFDSNTILSIPYFQRAYKWDSRSIDSLISDISDLTENDMDDCHFLGAIIAYSGKGVAIGESTIYEIIDGQQRLVSIYLLICGIIKMLYEKGEVEKAYSCFQNYVFHVKSSSMPNLKLHPCHEDCNQMNTIISDLISIPLFKRRLESVSYNLLPHGGPIKGKIISNYEHILSVLRAKFAAAEINDLEAFMQTINSGLSIVQIVVREPNQAPLIFDRLNHSRLELSVGDLIKNDIFYRVVSTTKKSEDVEKRVSDILSKYWNPFYSKFNTKDKLGKDINIIDEYFFPYGLIIDHNTPKTKIYAMLRKGWNGKKPEDIITMLQEYQDAFLDIRCGTNEMKQSIKVHESIARLYRMNPPSSIYPFIIKLACEIKKGKVSERKGCEIFAVVESFLVRRAALGIEPTGLHAVFKRLWDDCKGDMTGKKVAEQIRSHKTVSWPNESDFQKAFEERAIGNSAIARYILDEYDRSLGGDRPNAEITIEHILPDSYTGKNAESWRKMFTPDAHRRMKNLIGNLVICSGPMNSENQDYPYEYKKENYLSKSMYMSVRQIAEEYKTWGAKEITRRCRSLSKWATKRWPSFCFSTKSKDQDDKTNVEEKMQPGSI